MYSVVFRDEQGFGGGKVLVVEGGDVATNPGFPRMNQAVGVIESQ